MRASPATVPTLRMIVTFVHSRAWMGCLLQTGHRAGTTPPAAHSSLSVSLLVVVFVASLLLVVGASGWFTRRLETISDLFDLSAGLLSLLGATIPNYVASLVAAASGHLWWSWASFSGPLSTL